MTRVGSALGTQDGGCGFARAGKNALDSYFSDFLCNGMRIEHDTVSDISAHHMPPTTNDD